FTSFMMLMVWPSFSMSRQAASVALAALKVKFMLYLYGITTTDATPQKSLTNRCRSCGGGTACLMASRLCGINLHRWLLTIPDEHLRHIVELEIPQRGRRPPGLRMD